MECSQTQRIAFLLAASVVWFWISPAPACRADVSGLGITVHIDPVQIRGRGSDREDNYSSNITVDMPEMLPKPQQPQPQPQVTEEQRKREAAENWYSQGRSAMRDKNWQKATECFNKALENWDSKDTRDALKVAEACLLYEQRMKAEADRKGRELLAMSDCLGALSCALADVKSSVATSNIVRCVEAGRDPELGTQGILANAAATDMLGRMSQVQSSYARAPQPIIVGSERHLSDKQMAMVGTILFNQEMGFGSCTEKDIDALLGLPEIGNLDPEQQPTEERRLITAALDRFQFALIRGCNDAVQTTMKELDRDQVVQKVRTVGRDLGMDAVDPALRQLWEERYNEAHQRLYQRFLLVQDKALGDMQIETSVILRQFTQRSRGDR